jgi:type I restriction enzyme R subunit
MSDVGQIERRTQDRVVRLFEERLGYRYLGNRQYRPGNSNIEENDLRAWLRKGGTSETLVTRSLHRLGQAASFGEGRRLYDANHEVYRLLRYGVKAKEAAGERNQTVRLIDWERPENNDFAVAEEVTVLGHMTKRPDVVLYVNGIALAVLELKRSTVSVGEGIRQNLGNQKREFIEPFFTTVQLVMAGNDTEGLRYGTIETTENHYLLWREESDEPNLLDRHLTQLCEPARLLEIIHDFVVFDAGTKKVCRHNQYFGVRAARERVSRREGGIIWHTQGSGKSLTMVWLANKLSQKG